MSGPGPIGNREHAPATDRRALASLGTFIAVTFGSSWLIALPLWMGDGIADPLFPVVAIAVMFTPALGSLVAMTVVERRRDVLRGWGTWPVVQHGRWFLYLGLGLIIPVVLVMAALVTGWWLGQYPADFLGAGGLIDIIEQQGADIEMIPVWILVASQFVSVVIGAFVNTIPALGEEVGWRGWLVPRLMAWGAVPTIGVSGILWGLWHAPLILLGYNYPTAPGWVGLLMMTGMCTVVGGILAWLRIRSESVWPAALAHGTLNAAVGLSLVFAASGSTVDTVHATILGWSGWILPIAVVAVLLTTGQFRPARIPSRRSDGVMG